MRSKNFPRKFLSDALICSLHHKMVLVFLTLSSAFPDNLNKTVLTECESGNPADVVFVLDASNSIWSPDFERQLHFVEEMIKAFRIGPQYTQVALITYADYPIVQFQLDYYDTKPDVLMAISQIRQNRGFHTKTSEALRYMRERCFSKEAGAREHVTRLGVVVTDGQSDDPELTIAESSLAKEAGIHMFAVGVGVNHVPDELNVIASLPTAYYTFMVENYEALTNIRDLLAIKACSVTDPPTTTTMMTTTTTTTNQPSTTSIRSTVITQFVSQQRKPKDKRQSTTVTVILPRNVITEEPTDSKKDIHGREEQHRDGIPDVINTDKGLHNPGIKVVLDNSNDTHGVVQSDWTYNDHLQKWILKKPRRDDIRQDSGFWSYNEAERLVWTPTEYYYQRKREHNDILNYNESDDSADSLVKGKDSNTGRKESEENQRMKPKKKKVPTATLR